MYKCRRSSCSKVFNTSSNQYRHERNCKNGEMENTVKECSLECKNQWCDKVFDRKFNLIRHMETCKMKVKKCFTCEKCDCSFFKMSKLKSHQKIHALKSLYCCETCSNIYEPVDKFNNHVKRCKGKVDNADNDICVNGKCDVCETL